MYLLASALAQCDFRRLASWEWAARLGLSVLIMFTDLLITIPAVVAGIVMLIYGKIGKQSNGPDVVVPV